MPTTIDPRTSKTYTAAEIVALAPAGTRRAHLSYVVESRGFRPAGRVGTVRLFDALTAAKILTELRHLAEGGRGAPRRVAVPAAV